VSGEKRHGEKPAHRHEMLLPIAWGSQSWLQPNAAYFSQWRVSA